MLATISLKSAFCVSPLTGDYAHVSARIVQACRKDTSIDGHQSPVMPESVPSTGHPGNDSESHLQGPRSVQFCTLFRRLSQLESLFSTQNPGNYTAPEVGARRKEHLCRKSQRLRHESPAIRYRPCRARLIESPRRQFLRHFSHLSLPVIGTMLNAACRSVCRHRR